MRIILSIFLLSLFACVQQPGNQDDSSAWIKALADRQDLSSFYTTDAYHVTSSGEFITGAEAIADNNHKLFSSSSNLEITCSVPVADSLYFYELGRFSDKGKTDYHFLIIRDGTDKRLLELIVPKRGFTSAEEEIATRRKEWMKFCNAHQVEELVNNLYTDNTLYYNYKPMTEGPKNVISTYAYMNREQYSLQLNPICVEQFRDDLVFEIGQCSGSYNGQYVLVWQKQKTGEWRILLDANK